ncbi:hypothetical protein HU200_016566 [Digitaria exilis]|uniref:Uncharacterized protein n=1 Tax=Digitaria exilis TaxID=1010633 RepID=A0A835KIB0_9POAL|nr:hypothetical protein HU200_016566 [Digitaria exilis]
MLNDFAEEHNRALRLMLERIVPRDDPTVTIIYGDYYGAILEITPCCGDSVTCNATSILCSDPQQYGEPWRPSYLPVGETPFPLPGPWNLPGRRLVCSSVCSSGVSRGRR